MVKLSLPSINLLVKAPKNNFRTTTKKWTFWTSYFLVVLSNCYFVQTTNLNSDASKCVNTGLISTRSLIEFLKNDLHNIKINRLQYYITNHMSC